VEAFRLSVEELGSGTYLAMFLRGGFVTPRVHSGLTYPETRAGGSLMAGGFVPASHEAVYRLLGGWLRSRFEPLPISGDVGSLSGEGAAFWVGIPGRPRRAVAQVASRGSTGAAPWVLGVGGGPSGSSPPVALAAPWCMWQGVALALPLGSWGGGLLGDWVRLFG